MNDCSLRISSSDICDFGCSCMPTKSLDDDDDDEYRVEMMDDFEYEI